LLTFEFAMLNIVIRAFVRDLANSNVRIKITWAIVTIDRFLKVIYNLIKKTCRIKIKIKKLQNVEFKNKELEFYRIFAQKVILKTQLNSLITIY